MHQLLQWHHMLTSTDTDRVGIKYYSADTVPGLQMNTVWDGLFHTATWLSVLIGLGLLYSRITTGRARLWASRALWGWILVGWGLFNLVEGVVDHHILGIHHVHGGPYQLWWDLGFLALGAVLVAGGWLLQRGAPAHDHADQV
ncbi:membrane protein [Actinoplanes italicus]|nr:membrane protein [Actinoplanes italicus]